jgi:hypothetical protein
MSVEEKIIISVQGGVVTCEQSNGHIIELHVSLNCTIMTSKKKIIRIADMVKIVTVFSRFLNYER